MFSMTFASSFVFCLFATLSVPAVVEEYHTSSCSLDEFKCGDGACVRLDKLCDGFSNCFGGSDEAFCDLNTGALSDVRVPNRHKRQSNCRRNQWQCRDGSCISFDEKCDGVVNCPDGSDETHALCRKTQCQSNWFRCTYGACVDGNAPCDGKQDCADNSDELLPRCRNETVDARRQFECENGVYISAISRCDGVKDCADGSDETIRACAGMNCPSYLFQCAYGACVDQGADCNKIDECADGSDESPELCGGNVVVPILTNPPTTGSCVLPPYPDHGAYVVTNMPKAVPGQRLDTFELNVTCKTGYGTRKESVVYCLNGKLSTPELPQCVPLCKLNEHPSVEYVCILSGTSKGTRPCRQYEPIGTKVEPKCRTPNYYSPTGLNFMICQDGGWDYVATCVPECGKVTPDGEQLIIDGWSAKHGELPWHTGIYRKTTNPYMQICGGSLVSTTVVITAAHCFWDDLAKLLPAENFAVAVGKIYRPWNDPHDTQAQKSDVREIKVPEYFRGATTNFQSDIAMVFLVTAFEYQTYVRPICLDFGLSFEKVQLIEGNLGKVAGWGLTAQNGKPSPVLKVITLPYVEVGACLNRVQASFREYITSDKICAGYGNGSALCKGDSGGGLVFPHSDKTTERYYLRGIVSTAPNNEHLCNAFTLTTFTKLLAHEYFIKENMRRDV